IGNGAEIVSNLQQIRSRNIDVNDKVVLSVTKFHAGIANNIIPSTVEITGSVRTTHEKTRAFIPKRLEQIVDGLTQAHGATYDLVYNYGYNAVINDKHVTKDITRISEALFGSERVLI